MQQSDLGRQYFDQGWQCFKCACPLISVNGNETVLGEDPTEVVTSKQRYLQKYKKLNHLFVHC